MVSTQFRVELRENTVPKRRFVLPRRRLAVAEWRFVMAKRRLGVVFLALFEVKWWIGVAGLGFFHTGVVDGIVDCDGKGLGRSFGESIYYFSLQTADCKRKNSCNYFIGL